MKRLNLTQRSILYDLVSTAKDALEWDEDLQCYADGGRMFLTLSKEEYNELVKIEYI